MSPIRKFLHFFSDFLSLRLTAPVTSPCTWISLIPTFPSKRCPYSSYPPTDSHTRLLRHYSLAHSIYTSNYKVFQSALTFLLFFTPILQLTSPIFTFFNLVTTEKSIEYLSFKTSSSCHFCFFIPENLFHTSPCAQPFFIKLGFHTRAHSFYKRENFPWTRKCSSALPLSFSSSVELSP